MSGRRAGQRIEDPVEEDLDFTEETFSLVRPFEPGKWFSDQIRRTPWWAISVAFHLLLIASATLALFQFDGPDGPMWKSWNEAMKTALVRHQKLRKDGCEDGSWDPAVDRWGFAGGRIYATAINTLTLEVYYRYDNVFGAGKRRG